MEFSLFVSGYQKNLSTTGFLLDDNPDLELVNPKRFFVFVFLIEPRCLGYDLWVLMSVSE